MHLNPIFYREIKQNARTKKTAVLLIGVTAFLFLFALLSILFLFSKDNNNNGSEISLQSILSIYVIITGLLFLSVLLIVPSITAGSISNERERHTLDLMLCAKITPKAIIYGKLSASLSLMFLILMTVLPVFGLLFFIGGITFLEILKFYGVLFSAAVFAGSIGIFFSSFCRKTIHASIAAYLTIILGTAVLTLIILWKIMIGKDAAVSDTYLLFAPCSAFTYLHLLREQIGITLFSTITVHIKMRSLGFLYEHFVMTSICIQLFLSFLLNLCSARILKRGCRIVFLHSQTRKN